MRCLSLVRRGTMVDDKVCANKRDVSLLTYRTASAAKARRRQMTMTINLLCMSGVLY